MSKAVLELYCPCAAATQTYLDKLAKQSPRHHRVALDAYLIAPPNVGDSTFVAAFNQKVNARRVPFVYDVVSQVREACAVAQRGGGPACTLLR